MTHPIDNQYRYGVVYNLNGQIVGFNLSPDVYISLTNEEIEKVLEAYAKQKHDQEQKTGTWSIKDVADTLAKHGLIVEQKPCNDCVSRQAVLDTIDSYILHHMGLLDLKLFVTELSSVLSPWIPVSERLPDNPENNDYYLVTSQCEHYDGWDDYVTGFAEWTEHGWDELSCYVGQIKVVAWMPLPEPYKEESEGE